MEASMKITHNKVGQNLNLVDGNKSEKMDALTGKLDAKSSAKIEALNTDKGSARVEVSPRAQEAKRIKELAMAGPDVDQVKVEKFRRLIDEGKYKVDADQVADKMVDEHLEIIG